MTSRTIAISDIDLAALLAVRSVIADAPAHPGRDAAIAVLDQLQAQAKPQRTIEVEVKLNLIDFVAALWPMVYPDQEFVRTPVVELICETLGRLGGDPKAAAETRVTVERPWSVRRSDGRAAEQAACLDQVRAELKTRLIVDDPQLRDAVARADDLSVAAANRLALPDGLDLRIPGKVSTLTLGADRRWHVQPEVVGTCSVTFTTEDSANPTPAVAAIGTLYGFDMFAIERDDSANGWVVAGTRKGRSRRKPVADRDLRESALPTSPWFQAIRELALDLDVPDIGAKDAKLVELLTRRER